MNPGSDPEPSSQVVFDAIVLAGGGGTRLGGVSKADLVVGGRRLLDISLDAVRAARARVVVGAVVVPAGVLVTQEHPPGGGPAAGLQAGLLALADHGPASDLTVVVAVDHPGAVQAVADLLAAVRVDDADVDGWCVRQPDAQPTWLLGAYRTSSLSAALAGDQANRSIRSVMAGLHLRPVDTTADLTDLDTPADAAHWGLTPT